jgi:hypothetical protein
VIIGIAAAILLLTAGYLLGANKGREARAQLRDEAAANAEELTRLRERVAQQDTEDAKLRAAIQSVLTPLVQREKMSLDLSRLEGGGPQRDLTALLDQVAEKGNFSAVLLSDEQGWPLASSTGSRDLEKLGATSSLMLLLADRMGRDGSPVPLSLMVHDSANRIVLCRLFHVENQRLSLTAVSVGGHLTPAALDPALVKLNAVLVNREPASTPGRESRSKSG